MSKWHTESYRAGYEDGKKTAQAVANADQADYIIERMFNGLRRYMHRQEHKGMWVEALEQCATHRDFYNWITNE